MTSSIWKEFQFPKVYEDDLKKKDSTESDNSENENVQNFTQ